MTTTIIRIECEDGSTVTIDPVQGTADDGRPFGYVACEGGGWFFTWASTLEATLDTLDEDEVDGPGGLTRDDAMGLLEEALPGTEMGRRLWA